MGIGALYIHVPFCAKKCAYCDFASGATRADDPRMDAWLASRLAELRHCAAAGLLAGCRTAYLGGGTPSFLGAKRIGRLARAVRDACPGLEEFSCEANPDSLFDEVLDAFRAAGVTRVSVGVQSFDDRELAELGRIHDARTARRRVAAALAAEFDVSVDLMCAIPLQTDDSWRRTLEQAVALGVGHVSVYPLSIEEGTPFGECYADEAAPFNDEDVQAERMEEAERVLSAAGLARYEVASYARPGKMCAHNVAYWTGVPYLGLGPGAASMLDARAYDATRQVFGRLPARPADAARMRLVVPGSAVDGRSFPALGDSTASDTYAASDGAADWQDRSRMGANDCPACDVEFLSEREAWAEDLMLGMRLTRGIAASRLDAAPGTREDLLARGLVEKIGDRLVPTHDGWLLGNELYGALWDLAS